MAHFPVIEPVSYVGSYSLVISVSRFGNLAVPERTAK